MELYDMRLEIWDERADCLLGTWMIHRNDVSLLLDRLQADGNMMFVSHFFLTPVPARGELHDIIQVLDEAKQRWQALRKEESK
jgi:hypothetical protein